MPRPLLALLLLAGSPALASPARAEAPAELAARVVKAYGGRSALERARVVLQEGILVSAMHEGEGRVVRLFQWPASLRVEIAFPGEPPEVRIVHGGYGERDGQQVGGPQQAAMVLQAARLALPLVLQQPGARLADRGTVERDGRRLRALALALPQEMELVVEIDPATHRIVRSSGSMPGPGGRIEFATEYSKWMEVSGVLFAFHEENWARGHHTGSTSLRKVTLLPAAPPGAFPESL